MGVAWLVLAGMSIAFSPAAEVPARVRYDGQALVRIVVPDRAALERVEGLGLDLWDDHPSSGTVVARVRPQERALLEASGLSYVVLVPDLQAAVDLERARLEGTPAAAPDDAFFDDVRSLAQIDAYLDTLAALRPDLATVVELGDSLEGRAIRGLRITSAPDDAPGLLLNATQHAREWIAPMTAMCVADQLVREAESNEVSALLDQVVFYVVPVVNPDGYVYSWDVERFWRKNRRDGVGVDLNRNFGTGWGGPGASDKPQAGNYHGEAPFSEPETVAIRDFVLDHPEIRAHLDVHSFGQLVLYPWSFTEDPAPAQAELQTMADEIAAAMGSVQGTEYTPMQGVELYPASGTAPDWTYGTLGIFAFTLELLPDGAEMFETGFLVEAATIRPTCDEVWAATMHLAAWTATADPVDPGDDGNASTTGTGEDDGTGNPPSGTDDGTSGASTGVGPSDATGTVDGPGEEGSTSSVGSSDATGDTAPASEESDDGCGCRSPGRARTAWWLVIGLCLIASRRRAR